MRLRRRCRAAEADRVLIEIQLVALLSAVRRLGPAAPRWRHAPLCWVLRGVNHLVLYGFVGRSLAYRNILDDILQWAVSGGSSNDSGKERILLLHGMAGTGKSTIANTIASRLYKMERLGASYSFSKDLKNNAKQIVLRRRKRQDPNSLRLLQSPRLLSCAG